MHVYAYNCWNVSQYKRNCKEEKRVFNKYGIAAEVLRLSAEIQTAERTTHSAVGACKFVLFNMTVD